MINWINGHSNIFKCLVNHDGIFDLRGLYYSTEELWFPEWEFGLPWANADALTQYDKWSPARFLTEWQTPTLVIQGGKDYRVVETESISTFTVLQRRNIPSQFLFFPDENHWCLKPMNSILWHNTISKWLERWLK
jgi:dipeptidyl aminopeptidase/acylaminoacyl peptidase